MGFRDIFGMKQQVEVKAEGGVDVSQRENKSADIFKAYIPNFLYKPPFGMPRRDNPVQYKELAKNPYIFSITKTLQNEAASVDWEVKVKEEFQDDGVDYEKQIKEITRFLKNPNRNEQSFNHILRQLIADLLETDSAVLVKVFNRGGKFSQMFARDGSLFLKNPDIYGYMGDRADFVMPMGDAFTGLQMENSDPSQQQMMNQYELMYKDQAAYFQYGWTAGSMPVPFGKREIIYIMQHPRADSIYGTAPISRVIDLILNLVYGMEFNLDFYTNNNMPDGVVSLLGATTAQIKQYRENMDKQFKFKDALGNLRKKFFKVPITSVPATFTPFSMSSKDMEVIAQQEWFTKVLWMCFGVNADEMGFTQDSNKTDGQNQIKTFKRKAVRPLLDVIQYHLNTQLITEFFNNALPRDCPLEFVFDTYDIEEDIKELTKFEQEIRMGIKTAEMVAEERGIDFKEVERTTPEEPVEEENNGFPPKKEEPKKESLVVKKGGAGSGKKGHTTAKRDFTNTCDRLRKDDEGEKFWQEMMKNKKEIDKEDFLKENDPSKILDEDESFDDYVKENEDIEFYKSKVDGKEVYFFKTVVKKGGALPKENPLKEIEAHIDNIRDDITNAIGDLDENELRI